MTGKYDAYGTDASGTHGFTLNPAGGLMVRGHELTVVGAMLIRYLGPTVVTFTCTTHPKP